jgi:aspartyl/asparaginyl beta-hydroxylase (cupin superfamily)
MENIIILIILIIIFYNIPTKKYELYSISPSPTSKCWVDNKLFPEAQKIFDSKHIILQELIQLLNSDKWSIWSSDYKTTPIFTLMTQQEIIARLVNTKGKINSKTPSWRLYGLILNKQVLPDNQCPRTIEILQKYSSRVLNAGFSLLESGCVIGSHQDYNDKFYRLHIPILIPKANNKANTFINRSESKDLCVLELEQDCRVWKDDEYFIFDDTCIHNAYNNTEEIRIVLIVDLEK